LGALGAPEPPPPRGALLTGHGLRAVRPLGAEGRRGEEIEYSAPQIYDAPAVELARVLSGEGGGSLEGMVAIAHVVANRILKNQPAAQVDTASTWPDSFINTAYRLRGSEPIPPSWTRPPYAAARLLARLIIRNGGVVGRDPTGGALYYCTVGTTWSSLEEKVVQGLLCREEVGGNLFYGCGPGAASLDPAERRRLECFYRPP
jgi:hypothetical protein